MRVEYAVDRIVGSALYTVYYIVTVFTVEIFLVMQSRTGGVLGAVPPAAVMGARRIVSRGGKFRDAKKLTIAVALQYMSFSGMHLIVP